MKYGTWTQAHRTARALLEWYGSPILAGLEVAKAYNLVVYIEGPPERVAELAVMLAYLLSPAQLKSALTTGRIES